MPGKCFGDLQQGDHIGGTAGHDGDFGNVSAKVFHMRQNRAQLGGRGGGEKVVAGEQHRHTLCMTPVQQPGHNSIPRG